MEPTLTIKAPFPLSTVAQTFGANANPSYERMHLKGHTGTDFGEPWGTPIPACADGYVYSLLNEHNPDPAQFRAVYTLVEPGDGFVYEVSYGHLDRMAVAEGDYVKVGDIVGYEGNTGDVFSGNYEVTSADRLAGSHAGAHLHFQIRKCVYVDSPTPNVVYLYGSQGIVKYNGKYIQVVNYDNGYNGCIAPNFDGIATKNAIPSPAQPPIADLINQRNTLLVKALGLAKQLLASLQSKLNSK